MKDTLHGSGVTVKARSSTLPQLEALVASLDHEEAALENFFYYSPDMFAILDRDCRLVKVNKAWGDLGYKANILRRRSILELVDAADSDTVVETLKVMQTCDVRRLAVRMRHLNGNVVPTDWSCTRIVDGSWYMSARLMPQACYHCPNRPSVKYGR